MKKIKIMNTGYAIAGASRIGLGVGLLMNNVAPYLMIGVRCGFLISMTMKKKNNKDNNDEN